MIVLQSPIDLVLSPVIAATSTLVSERMDRWNRRVRKSLKDSLIPASTISDLTPLNFLQEGHFQVRRSADFVEEQG